MIRQILTISMVLTVFSCISLNARVDDSSSSVYQENDYENQLNAAIAKAEQDVKETQNNATRRDMAPTWNSKLEYQNAIVQLEVKKTLVNNFKKTEALKSPVVRDKLLQILNKPMITTADLAELQSIVIEEKSKMRAADNQATPTVQPVPSNSFPSNQPPSTNRLPN